MEIFLKEYMRSVFLYSCTCKQPCPTVLLNEKVRRRYMRVQTAWITQARETLHSEEALLYQLSSG